MVRDAAATRTGATARDGAVAQVDVGGLIATALDRYDSRAGKPQGWGTRARARGLLPPGRQGSGGLGRLSPGDARSRWPPTRGGNRRLWPVAKGPGPGRNTYGKSRTA